jgi:hypothetical protein
MSLEKEKQSKFETTNLMIHFESAFTNKTVGETFFKFLKTEFNSEPWLFLTEASNIKEQKTEKEKIVLVQKIVEKYIKDGSSCEINVSGKTKTDFGKHTTSRRKHRRMEA